MKTMLFNNLLRVSLSASVTLALLLAASSPANAALQVTLGSRGLFTTVVDNAILGPDVNPAVGVIEFSDVVVGGYEFDAFLSTTNSPGAAGVAFDTTATTVHDVAVTTPSVITIYVNSTGFSDPTGAFVFGVTTATFLTNPLSSTGAPVSVDSFFDGTDTASTSAAGTLIGSDSGVTTLVFPASLSDIGFVAPLPASYALNLLLTTTISGPGGDFDEDGQVILFGVGHANNPIPEPASMAMWGLGVFGLAGLRFRRRKSVA